jgi:hypothetical protein
MRTRYAEAEMTLAAVIAVALIGVLIAFQLALAAGAPFGAAAWGGRNPGVLPARLRIASAFVGLVVYPFMAAVVLTSTGVIDDDWFPFDLDVAMWVLAGFFALGVLANAISRSPPERIWSLVSGVLAVCCAVIALG